jgi:hypothetical protein
MDARRALLTKAKISEPLELLLGEGESAIWGIRVPTDLVLERWEDLCDVDPAFAPVILGDKLEVHREGFKIDGRSVQALFAGAARTSPVPRQWLLDAGSEDTELDAELAELHGPWPVTPPNPQDELMLLEGDGPQAIALLPGPASEAPLHLCYIIGAAPEAHTALFRYWASTYAARLVALTELGAALHVGKPPRDKESALQLATEQALYAGNMLGAESLEELAAQRMVDTVWHFEWDDQGSDD